MMKYPISVLVVLVMIGGCSSLPEMSKDCYSISQFKKFSAPSFSTHIMNVKSGEGSRIDVYTQVPLNKLRFEKTANGFKTTYTLAYVFRNSENEVVQSRDVDRAIETKTYDESVSNRFDPMMQSFILAPGEYYLEMISTDNVSKLQYRFMNRITAKDFSLSVFCASTELFLDTIVADAKGISLHPIIPSSISMMQHSIGVFQEIYNVRQGDTVTIEESYSTYSEEKEKKTDFMYFSPPYQSPHRGCVEKYSEEYYRNDSVFVIQKNGVQPIIQFFPLPRRGSTQLTRKIISGSDTVVTIRRVFLGKLHPGLDVAQDEITDAMRYIMKEEEYDSMMAVSNEKLTAAIANFWELHGGRQRLKDFERKISEANSLFPSCIEGSRTPMGILYIICGAPDYVDCRGGYYENWYYNTGEKSFGIQFRREGEDDDHNFALVPFSINDMMWQYFIDRWRSKK